MTHHVADTEDVHPVCPQNQQQFSMVDRGLVAALREQEDTKILGRLYKKTLDLQAA